MYFKRTGSPCHTFYNVVFILDNCIIIQVLYILQRTTLRPNKNNKLYIIKDGRFKLLCVPHKVTTSYTQLVSYEIISFVYCYNKYTE